MRTLIDILGKAVRTPNHEDEATSRVLLLLQPAGKLDAAVFGTVFVEQHDGISGLQLLENQFTSERFLVFLSSGMVTTSKGI